MLIMFFFRLSYSCILPKLVAMQKRKKKRKEMEGYEELQITILINWEYFNI